MASKNDGRRGHREKETFGCWVCLNAQALFVVTRRGWNDDTIDTVWLCVDCLRKHEYKGMVVRVEAI